MIYLHEEDDYMNETAAESDRLGRYLKLFTSSFILSACTFGGGFVIIPLMKKKFVDELHYIDENEMLDLTAIAQSSPGAIAVNAAILVGYRVGGFPGAMVSLMATVLPPLIIISIISSFYQAFRDNIYVSNAMTGMLAGVAAVITDVVLNMSGDLVKRKKILPVVMMILSFIAVRCFKVNIILLIAVCGAIGAIQTWYLSKAEKERGF
jgi:chromate transporter